MVAKIQQFKELKGFGFLLKDFRTRIFFHVNDWKSDIPPQVGMMVSYELGPSHKKGMPDCAVNIAPLPGEEKKFTVGGAK